MREPCTVLGSKAWQNYAVSVDARIEGGGTVSLYGRVSGAAQNSSPLAGYRLTISNDGRWTLSSGAAPLAEGRAAFDPRAWHTLKLTMAGPQITASLDGADLAAAVNFAHANGMAGLGTGWNCAEFDNFALAPVAGPRLVNLALGKKARASSQWSEQYAAAYAFDGDGNTRWNSALGKTAGEWLEVDFGRPERFSLVSVRQFDTRIARYRLQVPDGGGWRDMAAGDARGRLNWVSRFAPVEAGKLRLLVESTRGNHPENDTPSIYEIQVYDVP